MNCRRCGAQITIPAELHVDVRREIATLRQAGKGMLAMKHLVENHGLNHAEAKSLVLHIPHRPAECHRCRSQVSEGESQCAHCNCVNLDWR